MTGPIRCVPRVEDPILEAFRVTAENQAAAAGWCGGTVEPTGSCGDAVRGPWCCDQHDAFAFPGDVIVRGVTGHYWTLDAETFERGYREIRP